MTHSLPSVSIKTKKKQFWQSFEICKKIKLMVFFFFKTKSCTEKLIYNQSNNTRIIWDGFSVGIHIIFNFTMSTNYVNFMTVFECKHVEIALDFSILLQFFNIGCSKYFLFHFLNSPHIFSIFRNARVFFCNSRISVNSTVQNLKDSQEVSTSRDILLMVLLRMTSKYNHNQSKKYISSTFS